MLATLLLTTFLAPPALDDEVSLPPLAIPPGQSREVLLPALPARPGKAIVLVLVAYTDNPGPGGCNYNAALKLNGNVLGRYTAAGRERLIGRPAIFELIGHEDPFPVFNGPSLMLMYGPDGKTADAQTRDGEGGTFALDIGDGAKGVDGNVLELRNLRTEPLGTATSDLKVERLAVGWVDQDKLPKPATRVPERGAVAAMVEQAGLRLSVGRRGGFTLRLASGAELLVETGLGTGPTVAPSLTVSDEPGGPEVVNAAWGPAGWRQTAKLGEIGLVRTLELRDGLLQWHETWRNESDQLRGVPFDHQLFLRGQNARFRLAGSPEVTALSCSAPNPTVFLEEEAGQGRGIGFVAESDQLRLLAGYRCFGGVGEVYSHWLALPPRGMIDFAMTLAPTPDDGGYWTFINAVRRRWGVDGVTMRRPLFWGWAHKAGVTDPVEQVRQSLAQLGPVYVTTNGWLRLSHDVAALREGRVPRAADGTPDVEQYLTYAHREASYQALAAELETLAKGAPEALGVPLTHPAMEVVYKPALERWPLVNDAIRTADGEPFESAVYSQAHLGDFVKQGWGVLYFVPRPDSAYQAQILDSVERAFACGKLGGLYCDEFSWAWGSRGYSRYDYSRWDGFSADLGPDGGVVRLKSDNGFTTEASQLQLVELALQRTGFFLGNGGNCLRSQSRLPIHRFVEGGNGFWRMCDGHLSPVPLVLGNFGDETTLRGVFETVKQCLSVGCVYSPTAVNLLLPDRDNFVCKLYPVTVRELGPGWVVGDERVITTVSRRFEWRSKDGKARVWTYGADGQRVGEAAEFAADGTVEVTVPAGGMVVVEGREK